MTVLRLASLLLAAFWALVVPSLHGHPPTGGAHAVVGEAAGHHGGGFAGLQVGTQAGAVDGHEHEAHGDLPVTPLSAPSILLLAAVGSTLSLVPPHRRGVRAERRQVRNRGSPVARHEVTRI